MRISDWSSDVCSSDLLLQWRGWGGAIGLAPPFETQRSESPASERPSFKREDGDYNDRPPDDPPPRRLARPSARRRDARTCRALYRAPVRARDRHAEFVAAELGRASCRARVCQ